MVCCAVVCCGVLWCVVVLAFTPSAWEFEAGGSLRSRPLSAQSVVKLSQSCLKTAAVFLYSIYIKCPQQATFIKNACFEVEKGRGSLLMYCV